MSYHLIEQFIVGKNYRIADWGHSQNSVCIEYDTDTETDLFFFIGGPTEKFTNALKDKVLSQHEKDLIIRGTLNGILYAIGSIGCFNSFCWTE